MSFFSGTFKYNRVNLADFLKGAAVILMIQVHLTELFASKEIFESLYGRISLFLGGPPAAPVFMLVMGYLLVNKERTSKQLLIRGLKLFAGGILLNIGLNLNLLVSIFSGGYYYYIDPWRYIFGADILPLAGLSVIIFSVIQKLFKSVYILYFLLAVIVVSIQPLLPLFATPENPWLLYINAFLWGKIEWSYFPLIPWLAYPLTGAGFYYMHKSIRYRNEKIRNIYLISWTVFLAFTINYAVNIASNLTEYYHHNTLYYFWILIFLSGLILLVNALNTKWGKNPVLMYIKWLGQNVTAAYVFQWIIIGNFAPDVYKSLGIEDLIFWFTGILTTVTIFLVIFRQRRMRDANTRKVRFVQ